MICRGKGERSGPGWVVRTKKVPITADAAIETNKIRGATQY
ncbi:hypothetical protein CLOSTASPAR_05672 [[Clostridium] asparagiforme DSM 15981]|uniref:Uncharacterized protein n=1 Tax=[Clostridium] asparagiforme DSM 15981 TaxID=518636 RepID=C0D8S3_9FIRM|nr:hypothetical protein CLOSTASPAR_05672 [[Clostridium] asparagiforme DSM 15981]